MKQTPIPEKINHIDVESNPFVSIILLAQLTGNFIDVLTEQQDRLDRHNNRIEETNKHFGNKIKDLQKEIELLETYIKDHNIWHYTEKSYTAMRSTGEYCKCKEPHVTDSAGMDIVHCISCGKEPSPIKPQEDIEKFVDYSIKKYKKTYKALGNSQEDIREKIADLYVDSVCDDSKCRIRHMHKAAGLELADRILAIVKGE